MNDEFNGLSTAELDWEEEQIEKKNWLADQFCTEKKLDCDLRCF